MDLRNLATLSSFGVLLGKGNAPELPLLVAVADSDPNGPSLVADGEGASFLSDIDFKRVTNYTFPRKNH